DSSEIANLRKLARLNRVVAVRVDAVNVERRVRQRIGAGNGGPDLAGVAVVTRAQQRLLVGTKRVRRTDTRTNGVPLQRSRIAAEADCRQRRIQCAARATQCWDTRKVQRRREKWMRTNRNGDVAALLPIGAHPALTRQIAGESGVAAGEIAV